MCIRFSMLMFIFLAILQSAHSFADYMIVIQKEPDRTEGKFERHHLPVKVRPDVWKLLQSVDAVQPIKFIKNIPPEKKPQEGLKAQLRLYLPEFKIHIHFYGGTICEEVITHEILHAYMLLIGLPFILKHGFPVEGCICDLENIIQHYYIFQKMENIGFTPYLDAQKIWQKHVPLFCEAARDIPAWATDEVINTIGVTFVLGGIVTGECKYRIASITPQLFYKSHSISQELYESLIKYDLMKYEEAFQLRMEVCSKIGLRNEHAVISVLDFSAHKAKFYNIETGELIAVK